MRADLALIGFGHVGQRFAELILEQRGTLLDRYDLDCRVIAIATRRRGAVTDARGLDTSAAVARLRSGGEPSAATADGVNDAIALLGRSDAPLRVVVETTTLDIAAGQPAISHVEMGLDAGCHVVTANKGPAAFAYERLTAHAQRLGVRFLFEGAVMDGIPVFNLARETLPAVTITGFRGIVNSTTNHILTALEQGEEFAPALARMQAEGIAEADASLDVDGWDAAAKTAALANVLMDAQMTPHDVERTGLGADSGPAARDALRRGARLRLVASARRRDDGAIAASVCPIELVQDDLLAGVRGTANVLVLHTDLLGDIAIHQLGGGLTATAYALLSDLVAIRRGLP